MPENERVDTVIDRAESLVSELDRTVSDLVELLREYSADKETKNA